MEFVDSNIQAYIESSPEWIRLLVISYVSATASSSTVLIVTWLFDSPGWRRGLRKIAGGIATTLFTFLMFVSIAIAIILLLKESLLVLQIISILLLVYGGGVASLLAGIVVSSVIDRNFENFINSQYVYTYHNAAWSSLSVDVNTASLPKGCEFVCGYIFVEPQLRNKYKYKVQIKYKETNALCRAGGSWRIDWAWSRMMNEISRTQAPMPANSHVGFRRIRCLVYILLSPLLACWTPLEILLRKIWSNLLSFNPQSDLTVEQQTRIRNHWRNKSYLQFHRLALKVRA